MLYGAGQLMLLSLELTADTLVGGELVFPPLVSSFELSTDSNLAEAKALVGGKRQIVAAAITEETVTLNLSWEYADWHTLQMAFDELAQISGSVTLPQLYTGLVDSNGDMALPAITGTETVGTDLFLYVASQGSWGDREFIIDGAGVTLTTGNINIGSAYAGAVLKVAYYQAFTNIETLGVEHTYSDFGRLVFSGRLAGTELLNEEIQIIVPQLSRVSTPSLSITGDVAEISVEFRANVPSGKRRAFELYKVPATT